MILHSAEYGSYLTMHRGGGERGRDKHSWTGQLAIPQSMCTDYFLFFDFLLKLILFVLTVFI
jgi:hypothetical protein